MGKKWKESTCGIKQMEEGRIRKSEAYTHEKKSKNWRKKGAKDGGGKKKLDAILTLKKMDGYFYVFNGRCFSVVELVLLRLAK